MNPIHPSPRTVAGGDELVAALRRYARDLAESAGTDRAADVELSLIRLQKLATVGELAVDVAHEFCNLMTVILGYSELLLNSAQDGQPAEPQYLVELRTSAERASVLTTHLLGYSRRPADDAGPVDLGGLVDGLAPVLDRLVGSKARLILNTDPAAGTVAAEGNLVEQLLVNLVLNARDAVPVGGSIEVAVNPVRLRERLAHTWGAVPAGDYVRLRVRDDGHGMGRETVGRIFLPFSTTKGGVGLGLTVVSRVARKANAAVVVDSAPGVGTTFDIYFPRIGETTGNGSR